jgi:hypothetical protein
MQGVRRTQSDGGAQWAAIVNPSVFRSLNRRWTAGVETNIVLADAGVKQRLVMPQMQLQAGSGWIVQAGAGIEMLSSSRPRPAFAIRLTKVIR